MAAEQTCCDGTGWTGNEYERCLVHYEPVDPIWLSGGSA
jgi:hypothetical protein